MLVLLALMAMFFGGLYVLRSVEKRRSELLERVMLDMLLQEDSTLRRSAVAVALADFCYAAELDSAFLAPWLPDGHPARERFKTTRRTKVHR